MPLATQINTLASTVANYLRDSVRPRLIPAGGAVGQVLRKTTTTDYAAGWATDRQSFRNRIRNGNFSINQRAVSGTVVLTAGQYGHDGWKAGPNGCTYTITSNNGVTLLITITAGTLQQVMEGALYVPEGGSYTLSWSGTATGRVWQTSAAGAFVASPVTTSSNMSGMIDTVVEFGPGSLYLVQFEPGIQATSFEYRDDELSRCQRYFTRISFASAALLNDVTVSSSLNLLFRTSITPMRATPTVTISGITINTGATVNGAGINESMVGLSATTSASGRQFFTAAAGAYIQASAEL